MIELVFTTWSDVPDISSPGWWGRAVPEAGLAGPSAPTVAPANPMKVATLGSVAARRLDGRSARRVADGPDLCGVDVAMERTGRRMVLCVPMSVDGRLQIVDVGGLRRGGGRAAEDLGQVPAVVVGSGDDETPRGEERGEEGGLIAKAGVAVAEDDQGIATRRHRDAHHAAARVGHERIRRGSASGAPARQPGRHVIGGDWVCRPRWPLSPGTRPRPARRRSAGTASSRRRRAGRGA